MLTCRRAPQVSARRSKLVGLVLLVGLATILLSPFPSAASTASSPASAPSRAGSSALHLSEESVIARGVSAVASAVASLNDRAGPASSTQFTCGPSLGSSVSCTGTSRLVPRPAVSTTWSWINVTGSVQSNPGVLMLASMAYDAADGYVVLFGGELNSGAGLYYLGDGSAQSNTWIYQDGVWTQLTTENTPGARYGEYMDYDPAIPGILMFGGLYSTGVGTTQGPDWGYYNDTWTFSHGQWTNISMSLKTGPGPRFRGEMAYDYYDNYMLLFSGETGAGAGTMLTDSWKFDNGQWSKLTVTGSPPSRIRTSMAYDPSDNEMVTFGGDTSSASPAADTWTYKGGTWAQVTTPATLTARLYSDLATDWALNGVVLFGGNNGAAQWTGTALNGTWLFSNGAWTQLTSLTAGSPGPRAYGTVAYDPDGNYFLLTQGGNNAYLYNDTWTFGPNLTVFARATPPAADVGKAVTLSTVVVQGPASSGSLTYAYSSVPSLPTSCASTASSFSCTPATAGLYNFSASATDGVGSTASSYTFLNVTAAPSISALSPSPLEVDVGNRTTLNATVMGGSGYRSFLWSGLPPGCSSVNASTLPCTPTRNGTFVVRLNVTDEAGAVATLTTTLVVNSDPSGSSVKATPPISDVGSPVSFWANSTGGTGPFTYVWSHLPAGCAPKDESPIICSPIQLGTTEVNVTITDAFHRSVSGHLNITVNVALVQQTYGSSPRSIDEGIKVTFYDNLTGGSTPYNITFTGIPGCNLTTASSTASCIPHTNGTYTVTATALDQAGVRSAVTIPITINPNPIIVAGGFTVTPPITDIGGAQLAFATVAQYGTGLYTYAYQKMPPGCTTFTEASFPCSPSGSGTYTPIVTVTDSWGKTATAQLNVTIGAKFTASVRLTSSSINIGSSVTITAAESGGIGPFSYSYPSLPTGCSSKNASSITCTPSATGSFHVKTLVVDRSGAGALGQQTLNVSTPSSGSSGFGGTLLYAGIGIVVVVVVLALVVLLMRRRSAGRG